MFDINVSNINAIVVIQNFNALKLSFSIDHFYLRQNHQLLIILMDQQISTVPPMLPYIFIGLAVVFFTIYLLTKKNINPSRNASRNTKGTQNQPKINYGRIHIFYGSQTGTSAKLSEQLSEEGLQQGFQPEVIDLKQINIKHFANNNQISIFLLSNTGEGDPPENCVRWMKILKGKESLHQTRQINWKQINYAVFGLGSTQYQHYNITGITVDKILAQKGANRIYSLGLGDDNCSLEDDFTTWRKQLWGTLKKFRKQNPLQVIQNEQNVRKGSLERHEGEKYISKNDPIYANYKIYFPKKQERIVEVLEEEYDFKTKGSLKAQAAKVIRNKQIRQNLKDGSTLQLQIELPGQPEYQTAGNIALYGKNSPDLVKQVTQYFEINQNQLDTKIALTKVHEEKKVKLNFVPSTLRSLFEQSIDLQGKITKSILKKLSKFESVNPQYFIDNSSPKTTDQYKRIAEKGHWYYPIKIIKQHKVKLTIQDFIQLSDSMAPRLFTIASHSKTQNNVIVAASIVENGLISKYFETKPMEIKAQLRKSSFTDAMKWKKVIFVAAGTGLAPFRAYIQEKAYNITQKKQGKQCGIPIISLFFGCKHENGDFIYKDQILAWRDNGVIDRLHLAFSRDNENKVYVQHLLEREEAELKDLGHCNESAIYICGSFPMGNTIIELLTKSFGAERVKQMEEQGRIVKELW